MNTPTTVTMQHTELTYRSVGRFFRFYNLATSVLGYTASTAIDYCGGQTSAALPTVGNNKMRLISRPANQSGAVLIISLIMLLLLTIIGTVGMQTATMEEKMAGNKRDYNLAFQAAESALRAAESTAATITPNDYYTGSTQPIDWTDAKVKIYNGGTLKGLHEAPKYIIEEPAMTSGGGADDCPPCEGGSTGGGGSTSWYRITARGTGGTTNAVVTLQSIYKQ